MEVTGQHVDLDGLVNRCADPAAVRAALDRLGSEAHDRLLASTPLAEATVTVMAASRSATRLIESDPAALDVLADLDAGGSGGSGRGARPDGSGSDGGRRRDVPPDGSGSDDRPTGGLPEGDTRAGAGTGGAAGPLTAPLVDAVTAAADPDALVRAKRRAQLRITARDLRGVDGLEATAAALADLATAVLGACVRLAGPRAAGLAVVGMGKLGGRELNYASDIDLLFVEGDPWGARAVMDVARRCYRVDANLRPEGRDGPLTRSLESYVAYWQRWARPWEFQALIKATPVAGDAQAGRAWAAAAGTALWDRTWSADDLRSLRTMRARGADELRRKGTADREIKRGPGGIRDIEFAVQTLQLAHGGADPELRSPTTLTALDEMARGGYVADDDADGLAGAYRFLRRVEHALQIEDEQQTHTVPEARDHRRRIARVLGYRGRPEAGPTEAFDRDLARQRNLVRGVHERLYFRPLLDALAGAGRLPPEAAAGALARFGFADVERTRAAVRELTRGLTRSSRMMQQLLPLVLDWLSTSPDPDLGLLGLRKLTSNDQRATELAHTFREGPDIARRLCELLGTSALLGDVLAANPDLIPRLADPSRLQTLDRPALLESAAAALSWRSGLDERQRALRRWRARHLLGVAARDVYEQADVDTVGTDLTALAEACVATALVQLEPQVPFAVVAVGRFAGDELSYASDLDVLFVHDGAVGTAGDGDHAEAMRLAGGVLRLLAGTTPAHRIYAIDATLRPEGRQGALTRSLDGYRAYLDRWAQTWERQALTRARPVAGDADLGQRFLDLLAEAVWERPFTAEHEREIRRMKARIERERIPPNEDPEFHLKLGRGSLSDVEWTVQLLQLRTGVRVPSTMGALDALRQQGAIEADDAAVLRAAYRYCEETRNRWWLVGSAPTAVDSLPARPDDVLHLARSFETTPGELRENYRRVTRRARRVVERLFYGTT